MNTRPHIQKFGFLAGIILLSAFSRILPHPFNFSPVSAMALFGAAYFGNRLLAIAVPLAAVFLSDLVLNNFVYGTGGSFVWFYDSFYWAYGTYALITLIGFVSLKQVNVKSVIGSSVAASVIFFLITNFACWPGSTLYTQDLSGLMTCYAAGLPFFGNTLAGDLVFSAVLFGAVEFAKPRLAFLRA